MRAREFFKKGESANYSPVVFSVFPGSMTQKVALGLIAAMLISGGCAREPGPKTLLKRAKNFEQKGQRKKACKDFKRVYEKADTSKLILEGVRRYVRCMHEIGRLAEARRDAEEMVSLKSGETRVAGVKPGESLWIAHYFRAYVMVLAGPGHVEDAMKFFSLSAKTGRDHFEPLYRLALLHLQREDFHEAEKLLRKANEKEPENPGILVSLARCLAVKGELDEALKLLRKAASLPISREVLRGGRAVVGWIVEAAAPMSREERKIYNRVVELMDKSLPGQATALMENALESVEGAPALHRLLGLANLKLGNGAQAVISLNRALSANPYDGLAASLLGAFYAQTKRSESAEKFLKIGCRMNPFSLLAHRSLGRLLLQSERFAEAERFLQKAVNISHREPEVLRLWALSLRRLKRYPEAVEALRETVRSRPKDYDAWMMLGDIYMEQYGEGKSVGGSEHLFRAAKKAFKKALEIRPGDLDAKGRLHSLDPGEVDSGFDE